MVASKDLASIFEFQCPPVTSGFIREPCCVSDFWLNCSFCKNILTFHVGDPKNAVNVFTIEKLHAEPRSKYLQKVIASPPKENTAGIIYLPETDPDIFRVWLNWNKSHRIMSPMTNVRDTTFDQEVEYMHLIKAYILGVFLDDFKISKTLHQMPCLRRRRRSWMMDLDTVQV